MTLPFLVARNAKEQGHEVSAFLQTPRRSPPWPSRPTRPSAFNKHPILDIQAEYVRRHGELLFREQVEEIIATLDQHYFLESDRFARYQKALVSIRSST
ncbi:MAG: hypothetical protein ACE5I9_00815 [Candidatus Methylomirabilales bacterium]